MNISTITSAVTSRVGRTGLQLQKSSPTIMFGAGVVGVVATVVLASKATLRLEETLNKHDDDMAKADAVFTAPDVAYDESDYRSDKIKIYARTTLSIVKLYGPAFIVGAASIAALTGSHVVLNRRYAGAVAAYGALEKAFEDYRARVVDEFGAEKDLELRHGVEELDETNSKGKTHKVKGPKGASGYAVLFDSTNSNWNPTPENNLVFLKLQQGYMNQLLNSRGHVFLNEVYDALDMERTQAGAVVGWVKGNGDDFVDFGIFDDDKTENLVSFMMGRKDQILLDFNVDGIIYNKI